MPDIMICVLDPQCLVRQYQLPHPHVYQKGSFPILVVQVSRLDRVEDDIDMGEISGEIGGEGSKEMRSFRMVEHECTNDRSDLAFRLIG